MCALFHSPYFQEWIVFAPENTTNHTSQTISIYDNLLNHVIDLDTVPENFYFFVINPSNLVEVGQESGEVFLHPENMLVSNRLVRTRIQSVMWDLSILVVMLLVAQVSYS